MLTKTVVTLLVSNIIYIQCLPQLASYADVSQPSQKNQNNVKQNQIPHMYSRTPIHPGLQLEAGPDQQNADPKLDDVTHNRNVDNNEQVYVVKFDKASVAEQAAVQQAKYHYSYKIDDQLTGSYNEKEEHRENGRVKGYYIYDDRQILRKVSYEADENGFRVLSDEILPSQRHAHLNGKQLVATSTTAL